jgi:DNA-binding transcriptional MerR regulator
MVMRTGQVARAAGVNLQTLRYYERRGLLPEPRRRDSGYRVCSSEAVSRVRFIKRAQELGFSLAEVEALLEAAVLAALLLVVALIVARGYGGELQGRLGERGAAAPVVDLHDIDQLQTAFNRDAGAPRLVLLFSPT